MNRSLHTNHGLGDVLIKGVTLIHKDRDLVLVSVPFKSGSGLRLIMVVATLTLGFTFQSPLNQGVV